MRIVNQFKFIGGNLLSEVADAIDDFRSGVVPEVKVEAIKYLDEAERRVDEVLREAQAAVNEVRQTLVDSAESTN